MMIGINSEGYIIKSINAEFEYVDCSIIKLKDNENIRLSFSGESEKEYFIQRSCDLEHWEILVSTCYEIKTYI